MKTIKVLMILGMSVFWAASAYADNRFWSSTAVDAFWSTMANWVDDNGVNKGIPADGDDVFINAPKAQHIINYNKLTPDFNSIQLDNGMILNKNNDDSLDVNQETIGCAGEVTFNHNAGGHNVGSLNIGIPTMGGTKGKGIYNLNDGTLLTTLITIGGLNDGSEIPPVGEGEFNLNSGTHSADGFCLGDTDGSKGTYNINTPVSPLSAGELDVYQWEFIGGQGTGIFNQACGTNYVSIGSEDSEHFRLFILGDASTGDGTYNLSGGSLTVDSYDSRYDQNFEIGAIIGNYGNGHFNQTGGDVYIDRTLVLGAQSSGTGQYDMSAIEGSPEPTTLYADTEIIGYNGKGTFIQTGGTNTVADYLYLGGNPGSSGRYELGGTGILECNRLEIGPKGTGTFIQTGGSNTVSGDLLVGGDPGSKGTYDMQGGILTAQNIVNNDTFKIKGGTVNVTDTFTNNKALISDPAVLNLTNLVVNKDGYITAAEGDQYNISGNFFNYSLMNTDWNTAKATLTFTGNPQGGHTFYLAGKDLKDAGYEQNFAWGTLDISGEELILQGNTGQTGAFYTGFVKGLDLDIQSNTITNIYGNGMNIYYLASADIGLGQFKLNGGQDSGYLIAVKAVPEPISCALFIVGGGVLAAVSRRRKI